MSTGSDLQRTQEKDNALESQKVLEKSETDSEDHSLGYPTGWRLVIIILSLALGTLLMALDTTIISVAIPKISTEFQALQDVGWYGSGYLITLTAFQPVTGTAYRLFDPKIVYLVSIVVFEVGSVLCAAASSSAVFIIGRVVAGIGAAGLLQGALGIITYIGPLEKRAFYMSLVVSVFAISMCAAPPIGGALTDRVTWRWCFWINLPLGACVFALLIFFLQIPPRNIDTKGLSNIERLRKLDLPGIAIIVASTTCLFLALEFGGNTYPWNSATVIGLLVGFVLLLALFLVLQYYLGEYATISFRFLRQRTVIMGSIFLFFTNAATYLAMYYLPFYFQAVKGTTAIQSGVNFIAMALPQLVGLILSGALISKLGVYVPIVVTGQAIAAVGAGLLVTLRPETSTVVWVAALVILGFGLGIGINAPHVAIQAVFDDEGDVFVANGIATFCSQLGGSIAVSAGGALLTNSLLEAIPNNAAGINAQQVITSGPLEISSLAPSRDVLYQLRSAYSVALSHTFILTTVLVIVAIPFVCGMKWVNLNVISKERELAKAEKNAQVADPVPDAAGTRV